MEVPDCVCIVESLWTLRNTTPRPPVQATHYLLWDWVRHRHNVQPRLRSARWTDLCGNLQTGSHSPLPAWVFPRWQLAQDVSIPWGTLMRNTGCLLIYFKRKSQQTAFVAWKRTFSSHTSDTAISTTWNHSLLPSFNTKVTTRFYQRLIQHLFLKHFHVRCRRLVLTGKEHK